MIKKSASRNQRSKGAKVKHVLQILLLLCICFWLLYQIKRSYDRKRDMTEKDSKALVNGNDEDGVLKLGRKDLHVKRREEEDEDEGKDEDESSRGDRDDVEVDEDEIQQEIERNEERERQEGQEEEGDEEAVDNREEEDDKREEEEDNNKMEVLEDETGSDSADLNETGEEGTEVETTNPEEDFLDEDKGGREDRVNVNDGVEEDKGEGRREEQVREDDRSEDKDQDEVGENSHESREVHYREDDASSAVSHNTEADNGNTDLGSNTPGVESNSTVSIPHDLNQERIEATPGNQDKGKSSVLEVLVNQASNVVATGGMELAGLVSNVSETVTSLPQAQSLMTPDSGSGEGSLGQVTGVKMSNASTDERTANVSAVTDSSNKTNTTPSTSNEEPYKPLDLSNNQATAVSDGLTSLEKKRELNDASKALSTGNVNDNVIKMKLPEGQDKGESSTQ